MLANILYILSVVLPIVTAWVIDANKKLEAQKVVENGSIERARMSIANTNTRAKTAEHEQALTNALLTIQDHAGLIDKLGQELTEHTKQLSLLNDRV
jgi:hypothetical protein